MVCRYRSQFWAAEINIVIFIQRLDGGSGKQGSHDLVFPPVTITSIARDCGGSFLTAMRERAVLNDFHLWITPRTASAPFVCVAPCFEISAPYFFYGRTDRIKRRRHRSTYCLTLLSVLHRKHSDHDLYLFFFNWDSTTDQKICTSIKQSGTNVTACGGINRILQIFPRGQKWASVSKR